MDPNVALQQMKSLAGAIQGGEYNTAEELREYAADLAELVMYLDRWMTAGGFLPQAWDRV